MLYDRMWQVQVRYILIHGQLDSSAPCCVQTGLHGAFIKQPPIALSQAETYQLPANHCRLLYTWIMCTFYSRSHTCRCAQPPRNKLIHLSVWLHHLSYYMSCVSHPPYTSVNFLSTSWIIALSSYTNKPDSETLKPERNLELRNILFD